MVTTLGPIIKIYMQNMNGIFTSGTSLLSFIAASCSGISFSLPDVRSSLWGSDFGQSTDEMGAGGEVWNLEELPLSNLARSLASSPGL